MIGVLIQKGSILVCAECFETLAEVKKTFFFFPCDKLAREKFNVHKQMDKENITCFRCGNKNTIIV